MTPIEWLNQLDEETKELHLARVARLWCKNHGDFRVEGWDTFTDGMPFYDGKYGLTWEEALDLIEIGYYLSGMMAAFDNVHKDEIGVMLAAEIEKHRRWTPGVYDTDDLEEN